jgi:AraC-like DNA-binding protein
MDDKDRESRHLMLITPERVFYAGLLGRPRARCAGAFHVYVAIKGGIWISTDEGREAYGELLALPPNVRHTVTSDYRSVICVTIEPESVQPDTFDKLAKRLSGPENGCLALRIRAAYGKLRDRQCGDDMTSPVFDRMCFGDPLPRRALDPRIVRGIARVDRFSGEPLTAASCAREVGLSTSRFLHLFKQETGIAFRSFRAWKRARHLLHFANQDLNLAHLAQDIGYPDSTHFSHSIRRFYGLKPRAIFSGSRDLAIYRSSRADLSDTGLTQEAN